MTDDNKKAQARTGAQPSKPQQNGNFLNPDNMIADAGVAFVQRMEAELKDDFAEKAAADITAHKVKAVLDGREIKPALFWESITQASDPHSGARIRVWRKVESMPDELDVELLLLMSKIPGSAGMKDVFDIISTVEGVTAIELIDPKGNGGVKYLECRWVRKFSYLGKYTK